MAEINANDKKIKGVIIEAAGDVKQDGIIHTDKDAFVGIRTLGKYESNRGIIIQGESIVEHHSWYERWWGILILGIVASSIVAIIFYFLRIH